MINFNNLLGLVVIGTLMSCATVNPKSEEESSFDNSSDAMSSESLNMDDSSDDSESSAMQESTNDQLSSIGQDAQSSDESTSSENGEQSSELTNGSSAETDESSSLGPIDNDLVDPNLEYLDYSAQGDEIVINRAEYKEKLYGFWLGQCIANWTGLITEMDKIGGNGAGGLPFYTRENWGGTDLPSIWAGQQNSDLAGGYIDFVLDPKDDIWGSDDDTDIEYIYQYLLYQHKTSMLSGEQIRDGWVKHIYDEKKEAHPGTGNAKDYKGDYENYLWVSNQAAHALMIAGTIPPETSDPLKNEDWDMIDAQLTTEIFGFFAPARPDVALAMAQLPINTTARENAQWASEFYVIMYSLATYVDQNLSMKEKVLWMAEQARQRLPDDSYTAAMYDYVLSEYEKGSLWETARDGLNQKFQVDKEAGYDLAYTNADLGCFAAGINFGASIVSLLYGEGDIVETIKIGALSGWDSDNPTATWGGMLGFMLGKEGVEAAFDRTFSGDFNIHRTRKGFPNNGMDTFDAMAEIGVYIVDRAVQEEMDGGVDLRKDVWLIPDLGTTIPAGS
ncbi:MAG: ADP-ribosylglycohydrolase family protein [Fibrobacterales bacterium]